MKQNITCIQCARAIISTIGEPYQSDVVDLLRSLTYYQASTERERMAQKVITNMEHEYTLNVANVLWSDKYNEMPQWLKDYGDKKK